MDKFDDANKDNANENYLNVGNNERVGSSINSVSHEDEDDWSRQVETDETLVHFGHDDSLRMMESVVEEHDGGPPQPPSQRPLTLKEKLVMRERERRIETERARLKRQFALNNVEQDVDTEMKNSDLHRFNSDMLHQSTVESSRENGSVADTLGEESIVAHPDEENLDESRLGFNMERFLRNSTSFDPEVKPADSKETPDQGVLMERFLNEPLMPEVTNAAINGEANQSVSLDVDGILTEAATRQSSATLMMPPSFDDYTNASEKPTLSTMAEAHQENTISRELSVDDHDLISDVASSTNSHTHHEPRLLRLTEADMEELAAIDEASIGNAPPSEREETLSEIGELADFGGLQHARFGAESVDTPTTAQDESVTTSLLSGIQNINTFSELDRHSDQRSFEGSRAIRVPSPLAQLSPSSSDTRKANAYSSFSARGADAMDNQLNSSYHFDTLPPHSEQKDYEKRGAINADALALDIRSVTMEGPHEIDEIRIAAPGSPIHIDADFIKGTWSPKGGMNVSPLQVRRQVSLPLPRDPLVNYGSLEAGEMLSKKSESYLSHQEAVPLLSKVPPEVVMRRGIPWRHASEVRLSTVAVLATGLAVGLVVGIVIGATIVPLIAN
ncbi:hypothetical protein FisN_11Lh066 [Fistulifera solaris]|uniref:Uncharacterized protein n=1 Tax=Fistulifera solaris TaxID=1519565 RepID=A0A1Z5J7M9_FISSO|nr:hypothetical protein FisN_11Lh066 [Fistulifera solaris]|eukprot:GAX09946.1 hypothetical protein FisN_11Lh066 [Fistulifera solaris]